MKTFEFVAYDISGKRKQGKVKAWSLSEAKTKVQKRGYYLASIETLESSANHSQNNFSLLTKLREFFLPRGSINI